MIKIGLPAGTGTVTVGISADIVGVIDVADSYRRPVTAKADVIMYPQIILFIGNYPIGCGCLCDLHTSATWASASCLQHFFFKKILKDFHFTNT